MTLIDIIQKLQQESLGPEALQALLAQALREIEPLRNVATRVEFYQLSKAIEALTVAQEKTEKHLGELVEAEKRTEERLEKLAARVEELSEAQRRTEERLEKLAARVGELSEAQRRTEERLEKLAARVEELSEAQRRTEESLLVLTHRVQVVEDRLEGVSHSVGYSLENAAFKALPALLLERYGIAVQGRLVRRYIGDRQVNIFGRARRHGQEVVVVGECKVRPSRREVDRFLKIAQRLADQEGWEEVLCLFVAHDFPPVVEQYLRDRQVPIFWSYEF